MLGNVFLFAYSSYNKYVEISTSAKLYHYRYSFQTSFLPLFVSLSLLILFFVNDMKGSRSGFGNLSFSMKYKISKHQK